MYVGPDDSVIQFASTPLDGPVIRNIGIPVYSGIFLENMREARQPKMR